MSNEIKNLRNKKGLSQQELADMVGTSFQQISKLERGERPVTPYWARRIAEALEVEPIDVAPELATVLKLETSEKAMKLAQKLAEMEDKNKTAYKKVEKLIKEYEKKKK